MLLPATSRVIFLWQYRCFLAVRTALVQARTCELTLAFRRGGTRHISGSYSPDKGEGGHVAGVVGLLHDITPQKQKELAFREREQELRLAVEATDLGTWDFRPKTDELRWSVRCNELFGLPDGTQVDYDRFLSRLHPEDRERTHAASKAALALRKRYPHGFARVVRADWISSRGNDVMRVYCGGAAVIRAA